MEEEDDEDSAEESSLGSQNSLGKDRQGENEIKTEIKKEKNFWDSDDEVEDETGPEAWAPETEEGTTSTVEISISCRDLENMDKNTKTAPMCVAFHKPPGIKVFIEFMRTEIIENELNPDFCDKVVTSYYFDRVQPLRFQMYHMDPVNQNKLIPENSLGFIEVLLSQIVLAGATGVQLELNGSKRINDGTKSPESIILVAEELATEKGHMTIKLGGKKIGSWSNCYPPKTLIVISKMLYTDEKYILVHRSKGITGQSPVWPTLDISATTLCNGDMDRHLKIEIFEKSFSGYLSFYGSALTSVAKLLANSSKDKIYLMSATGQDMKAYIRVISCKMKPKHTFIDYIRSPMEIHCCFAIDFTCSNGNPEDVESLHYLSDKPNSPNMYEQAILAVGHIFKDYNTSSLFPTFGFGARLPPYGEYSDNFNVNLTDSPNCIGIPGVLCAYRQCLTKIQLYGPTNFSPVIKTIAEMAKRSKSGKNYYILIIMTDGVITDFELTKKTIVEASHLPLSIVIIGIGEMDFESMEELDGDAVRLSYKKKKAKRDIVQFVAYRSARAWQTNTGEDTMAEHLPKDKPQGRPGQPVKVKQGSTEAAPQVFMVHEEQKEDRALRILTESQLAQEILQEIPEQMTSYFYSKGVSPADIIRVHDKG